MQPIDFFRTPQTIAQKQYEALRMVFVEKKMVSEVAQKFGYTYRGLTTIISNFRKELKIGSSKGLYFKELKHGRREVGQESKEVIISLRKKYYSVEDIKIALDSKGFRISEKTIYNIIHQQGFARLPRRQKLVKKSLGPTGLKADRAVPLAFTPESFKSASAGVLCLLPYIKEYGIDRMIEATDFPGTTQVSKQSSILAFIALKATNARRYTAYDVWCMDRGGWGSLPASTFCPRPLGSPPTRTGSHVK